MIGDDIEIGAQTYRVGKLSAMEQFHVTRRILPLVSQVAAGGEVLDRISKALAELSDTDSEYVIFKCLRVAKRKIDGDRGWAAICRDNVVLFDDIGVDALLRLTWATIEGNMGDFFTGLRSNLPAPEA